VEKMTDKIIEVLEKIAKELELANRLKIFEIALKNHPLKFETLIKFYDKSIDLEEEIKAKLKK
jgi:hypothetical protein